MEEKKKELPDLVIANPGNLFIAVIRFLKAFNETFQSDDIRCLMSEMEHCNLAQNTWQDWQKALESVLIESGELENGNALLAWIERHKNDKGELEG